MMPFRLLRYMVRIWEQVLGETPAPSGLPLIVPVVLHTGPRHWNASISLAGLFRAAPDVLKAATPYIPDFRFVLDDLGGTSDEELRKRAVDAVTRLVLIALRHGRRELQDSTVLEWVDLLEEVFDAPNGLDAVRRVLGYILDVGKDVNIATLRRELIPRWGSRMEEVIVTEGERLRAEGRLEGRQQGRQEGWQEGRQQGMTAFLLRQLQKKFESVPEGVVQRVQTAPPDLLEKWTESILTAESLDEVFAS